jgi:glucokinase
LRKGVRNVGFNGESVCRKSPKAFATGGVFIGGGIGPKIRPMLESGEFMRAFTGKGRFQALLSRISVKLALNPHTPLLGAMHYFSSQQA